VEKYSKSRHATGDIHDPCAFLLYTINKLQTHSHNVYYLLFLHGKNGYVKAPQCYVIVQYVVCLVFSI